jgi:hypothetical protein
VRIPLPFILVRARHLSLSTGHCFLALFGCDGVEGRQLLLDLLTLTLRAGEFALIVFGQRYGQRKGLLALFAHELVHWHKPQPPLAISNILANLSG